jgi:hypothetical protein
MSEIYQKLRKLQAEREGGAGVTDRPAAEPPLSKQAARSAGAAPSAVAAMLTQMVERATAVARFCQDVDDRVSSVEIDGVEGIFMLSDRLRGGLDRVLSAEIEQAEAQLDRLREGFVHLGEEIERLRTLKLDVSAER